MRQTFGRRHGTGSSDGQVRGVLAQSYIDRIEKAGPVALLESRTPEEAKLIIAKRLAYLSETGEASAGYSDPSAYFGPQFYEEFAGLSTRRLLEHAHSRLRSKTSPEAEEPDEDATPDTGGGFISRLAAALGLGLSACDSRQENAVEAQAEATREASDAAADAMDQKADTMTGAAEASMEAKADAVREAGDAKADRLEDKADKMDKAPE